MERDCLQKIKENLEKAQTRIKMYLDRHRRHEEFHVKEWVYLKIRPYWQYSLGWRLFAKLNPKYLGLYQIINKVGMVGYKLRLSKEQLYTPYSTCPN